MVTSWNFHSPIHILFGKDQLNELPAVVGRRRVLLVTSPGFERRGVTERVRHLLGPQLVRLYDRVQPGIGLSEIEETPAVLAGSGCEAIIGLGGGTVLDMAKVLSLLLPSQGTAFSLREHLTNGAPLPDIDALPVIAIPTTAGSGSEVTPFATVWDWKQKKKFSLSSPRILAQTALLDPTLTASLPTDVTITSGLDSISHAFEAIWNRSATLITTLYATEALTKALWTLPKLMNDLQDIGLRATMMEASLLAGLAISNTRTALSHSISYPVTLHYGLAHGLASSFTLPAVLEFNSAVDDGRLAALAHHLGHASVEALGQSLVALMRHLGAGELIKKHVRTVDDLLRLESEMITPDRADNNLRKVGEGDLAGLVRRSAASVGL